MHDGMKAKDGFKEVLQNFSLPAARYAPYIFWFFDEDLDKMGIKPQEISHALSKKGFNPGYAHARPCSAFSPDREHPHINPLPPSQWLSYKWFEVMKTQVLQAKTDGTHFSFTDDYSWPSVQGGGRLVEADPSLLSRCLSFECVDLKEGESVSVGDCLFAVAGRVCDTRPASFVKFNQPAPPTGNIWHTSTDEGAHIHYKNKEDIPPYWRWTRHYCDQTPPDRVDSVPFQLSAAFAGDTRLTAQYNVFLPKEGEYSVYVCFEDIGDNTAAAAYDLAGERVVLDQRENAFRWNLLGTYRFFEGMNTVAVSNLADGILSVDAVKFVSENDEIIVDDLENFPRDIAYLDADSLCVVEGDTFKAEYPCRLYRFNAVVHRGLDFASIDYMQERISDLFIEQCWEPYFQKLHDFLGSGKTVNGIFSDHEGDYGYKMVWSDALPPIFKERYNEDIRRILPLLIDRDTKGTDAVWRFRWFDTVSDTYVKHFEKLSQKAAEHDLYLTAHVWEEALQWQAFCVGDVFKFNRALSLPGTDALHNVCFNPQNFKDFFSVTEFEGLRFMDEVAALIPAENYTPQLLKKQANCLAAYGVSHVINHSVKMTRPLAQTVVPPDFYNIDPCFNTADCYTEFIRRTSYINSLGSVKADVLLLNPLDSMYVLAEHEVFTMEESHFAGQPHICAIFGGESGEINRQYGQLMRKLTREHIEFLTADKEYVRRMNLCDGKLLLGGYEFGTVVLPRSEAVSLDVAEKLRLFVRAGGRLYVVGRFPTVSLEGGRDDAALARIWEEVRAFENVTLLKDPTELSLAPRISIDQKGEQVLCHHRVIDGRHFIFVCNNSDGVLEDAALTVRGISGGAFLLHPHNGERSAVTAVPCDDGLTVTLSLAPLEAVYVVVDPALAQKNEECAKTVRTVVPENWSAAVVEEAAKNTVALAFSTVRTKRFRLILRKGGAKDPTHLDVEKIVLSSLGKTVAEHGINKTFTVEFDNVAQIILPAEGTPVDSLCITTQKGLLSCRLEAWNGEWWNTVAEYDGLRQSELIHDVEYPVGKHPVSLTDWSQWSFLPARFAGSVTYETSVTLAAEDLTGKAEIALGLYCGAASLSVNGKELGHKMFAPFSFCVGDMLKEGENTLRVTVFNTISSNITGTHGGLSSLIINVKA